MTDFRIPFNRPSIVGRESEYVREACEAVRLAGNGPFTEKCERLIEAATDSPRCFLTSSGTDALDATAQLLDLRPGDDVIVPAFAFPSTASAFVRRGARPVFIDVRADTLNLDETQLERLRTPKTRAIVPVHYAGVACEMDPIMDFGSALGIPVVEDNAQGLFAEYRGRRLGSLGALAIVSFHETKNVTCGEGGALIVNDERFIDRAEFIIEKGTDRRRFRRGLVDAYTWVETGSGNRPSELQAAFLYGQLEQRVQVQARRREIFERYETLLSPYAEALGLQLPTVPPHCEPSFHMFYVVLADTTTRDRVIRAMKERGIQSVFHYMPLNRSDVGRRWGPQSCPVAESISSRILRLPFYVTLSADEQEDVVDVLRTAMTTAGSLT